MADESVEGSSNPRWWYGIAFFVGVLVLTWVSYGLVQFVTEPQPGSPPTLLPASQGTGLIFLFSTFTTAVLVLVGSLLAPLYSLSLYLDVRALHQNNSDWRPSRVLWGAVSLLHLGTYVCSAIQLVTIPAGVVYLYARRRKVGLR